jgi:hypothetical protein
VRIVVALRPSQAAVRARLIGALAVPILVLAGLGSRAGLIPPTALLPVLLLGLVAGVAAVCIGLFALVDIWNRGADGLGAAIAGIVYAVPALGVVVLVAVAAIVHPRLADVSTDPADPPAFRGIAAVHGGADAAAARRQAEGYPDLVPHLYDLPLADVHGAALDLVRRRGWTVTHDSGAGPRPAARPPAAESAVEDDAVGTALAAKEVLTQSRSEVAVPAAVPPGRTEDIRAAAEVSAIQAVATTLLFAFRDDVMLRFTDTPAGTRVDMRSASQIGEHDLGQNARRIRRFFADLDVALYGEAGLPGGSSAMQPAPGS